MVMLASQFIVAGNKSKEKFLVYQTESSAIVTLPLHAELLIYLKLIIILLACLVIALVLTFFGDGNFAKAMDLITGWKLAYSDLRDVNGSVSDRAFNSSLGYLLDNATKVCSFFKYLVS